MKRLRGYFVIILLLGGCADQNVKPVYRGEQYFPLEVGKFWIYEVQSTHYISQGEFEAEEYELKVEVAYAFTNGDQTIYVLHRSRRDSEDKPWEVLDTWSARITSQEYVIAEGDESYVKASFPIYINQQWNGNSLNTQEEDLYEVENVAVTFSEGEKTFANCVIINQELEANALFNHDRLEVYSKNIGLVYKRYVMINYCDLTECLGEEIITNGVEMYQVLKSYGE